MKRLTILIIMLAMLASCQTVGPTPASQPTILPSLSEGEVTLTTEDGVQLSGTVFGQGTTAVVLAHMLPTDQTSWQPFAQVLAERGFTALTFDFRGYGQSGGSKDYDALDKDVRAAVAFLRDRGFQRIVCIGASMGGLACGKVSHEPGLVGLVIISSPISMESVGASLKVTRSDLADLAYPKLFIVSREDRPISGDVRGMYGWASDPKELKVFDGFAHGTDLFDTEHADEFRDLLLNFFILP
jgi:pimeloyl-ACP methyl ester carboxylesterase